MKSYTDLWPQITSFENLYYRFRRARVTKHDRSDVASNRTCCRFSATSRTALIGPRGYRSRGVGAGPNPARRVVEQQSHQRAANRNNNTPDNRNTNIGFRCATESPIPAEDAAPSQRPATPLGDPQGPIPADASQPKRCDHLGRPVSLWAHRRPRSFCYRACTRTWR